MSDSGSNEEEQVVYAYEPDLSLKKLIEATARLDQIFTKERIEAGQKVLDGARASFFDVARPDIDQIVKLTGRKEFVADYAQLCKKLQQPVNNIKSQADVYGYSLISKVCGFMGRYFDAAYYGGNVTSRDVFIIIKLVELLQKTVVERVADPDGVIEREFVSIIRHM